VQPVPAPQRIVQPKPAPREEERGPVSPLTWAIIFANVAVFAAQVWYGGLSGLRDMSEQTVLAFGANNVGATLYEGRFETLLASCFVHGSLLHIAFNMVALRQVGTFVERAVGPARMATLYLLSGVIGSAASTFSGWLSGEQHISVGASGAICGLIGAGAVLGYRIEGKKSPIMRALARWLLSLLALDNAAHIGGAVSGALVASLWQRGLVYPPSTRNAVLALCAALVVATGVRVYRFDRYDPFATMTVDDRLAYAVQAIDEGHCARAKMALDSLSRLTFRAPDVQLAIANYHSRCGR
jgi:rhomboid protease GluP